MVWPYLFSFNKDWFRVRNQVFRFARVETIVGTKIEILAELTHHICQSKVFWNRLNEGFAGPRSAFAQVTLNTHLNPVEKIQIRFILQMKHPKPIYASRADALHSKVRLWQASRT